MDVCTEYQCTLYEVDHRAVHDDGNDDGNDEDDSHLPMAGVEAIDSLNYPDVFLLNHKWRDIRRYILQIDSGLAENPSNPDVADRLSKIKSMAADM